MSSTLLISVAVVILAIMGSTVFMIVRTRHQEASDRVIATATSADHKKHNAEKLNALMNQSLRNKEKNGNSIARRLACAHWNIPPALYYLAAAAISLVVFLLLSFKFHISIQLIALLTGPLVMNAALNYSLNRRFKSFDTDYPAFLGSVVSMLKTGLNPISALSEAAHNLNPESLIKEEVDIMLERLRLGVPEDQSIGTFAEDIPHPEVELFVQALLFSRRVGGALSQTLERLSKISRKRQYFRQAAVSAVGLQRGSIYMILGIMVGLEMYLYFSYPEAVVGAWANPVGWLVWQVSIVMIITGLVWMGKVTKIKV